MAHNSTLVQSGADFYIVAEDGGHAQLSEPSTVTITDGRPPRFEVNGVHAIVVNSVDQALIVDDAGIVLFFSPPAPTAAATLSSGTAGALTGTYSVKYTFAIRDLDGNIVAESGFSPSASTGAIVAKKITTSNVQTLTGLTAANYDDRYEVVRRFYRTATGGSTYFLWYTIEDNTTTGFSDDTSDAAIAALPADNLNTAPFLSLIASYGERMFGVDELTNREVLRYSETGLRWAWPEENIFTLPQVKGDSQSGGTALLPFRNGLGITKSNMLIRLTGTDDSTFNLTTISTSIGCVSQESAGVYRDQWYFLGQDGVYRWGEDGLACVSDPKVRSWFTTDTYFDRGEFVNAKGEVDVITKRYKLQLTTVDGNINWVEYDIESDTWWGPHRTDVADYGLTSIFRLGSHSPLLGMGTDTGYIVVDTEDRLDNGDTAIEMEGILAPIRAANPPVTTYFGELTTEVDPQAGGTLLVYPTVGEIGAAEQSVMSHALTTASVSLGRLGYGRFLQLRFFHNTINQLIQLLGFEVAPTNIVGRRQ